MKRAQRTIANVVAVGLITATFVTAIQGRVAGANAQVSAIDLSNPLAGIDDPSAGLPVTNMVCTSGQTDLNHAGAQELTANLSVAGPIAARIIEHRPYLAVSDLAVVEGIGGGRLAKIEASNTACTTPVTLPPALTDDVCRDTDERVDIHHTTLDELVGELRLGRPVAQRVLAGAPYATTAHLTRVAGIGPGGLKRIEALVCRTPAPFDTGAGPWRWATTSGGGHVDDGQYQLAVPPGVVADAAGAWLEIDVLDPNPGPTASFVVHGSWDGRVAVTLPQLPAEQTPEGWIHPIVIHNPDDPDLLWGPTSLYHGDGILTIATDTLSPYESSQFGGNEHIDLCLLYAPNAGNDPSAPQTPDGLMSCAYKNYLASLPAGPTATEFPGCENTDELETAAFMARWTIECSRVDHGTTASWTIENHTADSFGNIAGSGAVAVVSGDGHAALAYEQAPSDLAVSVARVLTRSNGTNVLFPGDKLVATVNEGQETRVDFDNHVRYTAALFGISTGVSLLSGVFPFDEGQLAMACALGLLAGQPNDLTSTISSFGSCARTAADQRIEREIRDAAEQAKAKVRALGMKIVLVGTVIDALVTGTQLTAFNGDAHVNLLHRPAMPSIDAQGRPVRPNCATPSGTGWTIDMTCQGLYYDQPATGGGSSGLPAGWIIRNAAGNTWLYTTTDNLYHPIPTGGDYECLAYHYWVDWNRAGPTSPAHIGAEAECPPGNVSPQRAQYMTWETSLWPAQVLREASGRAWMLNAGGRFEIPNGFEFNCFVSPLQSNVHEFHVWDQITQSELDNFAIVPHTTSNCQGF